MRDTIQKQIMALQLKNRTVKRKKPNGSCQDLFTTLTKGKGFTLEELSDKWGFAEDTIWNNAKKVKCALFVSTEEEGWVKIVAHPDTAKEYKE